MSTPQLDALIEVAALMAQELTDLADALEAGQHPDPEATRSLLEDWEHVYTEHQRAEGPAAIDRAPRTPDLFEAQP